MFATTLANAGKLLGIERDMLASLRASKPHPAFRLEAKLVKRASAEDLDVVAHHLWRVLQALYEDDEASALALYEYMIYDVRDRIKAREKT